MKRPIVSLYEYQKFGVETMVNALRHGTYLSERNEWVPTRCFLLFDEMGLGKTLQTCEVVREMQLSPVLVVGPAACLHVWEDSGFTMVSYDALLVAYRNYLFNYQAMSTEQLNRLCKLHNFDNPLLRKLRGDDLRRELLTIVRERILIRGKGQPSQLFTTPWACIIFDEAHKFKSPKSIRAKAVGLLQGTYRICLTGTPVMNHGEDMLSLFNHGLGLLDVNQYNFDRVFKAVSLGRKKADLPELIHVLPKRQKAEEVVLIDWVDPAQRAQYVAMKEDAIRSYNGNHLTFMAKLQGLRQICLHGTGAHPNHPWIRKRIDLIMSVPYLPRCALQRIVLHFFTLEQSMIQPSPKMMQIYQWYRPGVKMMIYSTYRSFLSNVMGPWLRQIGISSILFAGGMKYSVIERFKADPTIDILLMVKQVGAEGLNMQDVCNHCIIMDPHFNLALDEQAAQRIDRLGQQNEVKIRRLFMRGSIDEAMRIMQQEKIETTESWTESGKKSLETHHLFLTKYDTVV